MTPPLDTSVYANGWLDASGSLAEEHQAMHLYMFESTADDPTSRSFLPGDEADSSTIPAEVSPVRPLGKIRIRTYP